MTADGLADDQDRLDGERGGGDGPHPPGGATEAAQLMDEPRPGDGVDEDRDRELERLRPDRGADELAGIDQQTDDARDADRDHPDRDEHEGPVPPDGGGEG
jgi:hypothetical protein